MCCFNEECLWHNCPPVCWLFARGLYGWACMSLLLYLLQPEPLSPRQATADPRLHWRLLDTHRQVWVSLLLGHCSFLLGPGAHKVLFVPSKSLFPYSCGSPIINTSGLQSQSWGFSVPLPDPQVGNLLWALEVLQQFSNFFKL